MTKIRERDWKLLRSMQDEKLAAASKSILEKIFLQISQSEGMEHKAYLSIWKTMQKEDKNIELMFDDVKRSTAIFKLMAWKKFGFLSKEEELKFSPETQAILKWDD